MFRQYRKQVKVLAYDAFLISYDFIAAVTLLLGQQLYFYIPIILSKQYISLLFSSCFSYFFLKIIPICNFWQEKL